MSRHHRRARLPRAVHAGAADVHRAAEAARAVAPDRLLERRPLAELVRDGALLHRAPGVVPEVPRRRRSAVVGGGLPPQRRLRHVERQAHRGEEGSAREHAGEARGEAEIMKAGIDKILKRAQAEYLDALLPPRDALLPKLERGATIVCDNLLWGGKVAEGVRDASTDALRAFNRRLTTDPRLTTTIVAVGDGLGVAVVN